MRSDLKAIQGVYDVETDLDAMTCTFKFKSEIDVKAMLEGLVEINDKFADWSFQ